MPTTTAFATPSKNRNSSQKALQLQGILRSPACMFAATPTRNPKAGRGNSNKKTLYLIRHGHSLGQAANRKTRERDPSLVDCGLSKTGRWQAETLVRKQLGPHAYQAIELVVSSPLTRALLTACLAFPDKPILCHYHLRELGTLIPENIPRPTSKVLRGLQAEGIENLQRIDVTTLRPDDWPMNHDVAPKVLRRDRVKDSLFWLAKQRPEQKIAVVCHYHIIRAALGDPSVRPENAQVIQCEIDMETGEISRTAAC